MGDMKTKASEVLISIPLLAAFQAVDDEPEYPGEMPDEMYEAIRQHKDTMEEALRITVRLTKQAIRLRLEQAANKEVTMRAKRDSVNRLVGPSRCVAEYVHRNGEGLWKSRCELGADHRGYHRCTLRGGKMECWPNT